MKRVELVDASVLINLVDIPMEADRRSEMLEQLKIREAQQVDLIIPVAAIIETSQHVQRINEGSRRRRCAQTFRDIVNSTLNGTLPWRFSQVEWDTKFLASFLEQTPPHIPSLVESLANKYHEAGDLLLLSELKALRDNLPAQTHQVGVWTLDSGLDAVANGAP